MAHRASMVVFVACAAPGSARAQACCAGGSAVTPGRLQLHEDALVGIQSRAGAVFGSFNWMARYVGSAAGDTEYDIEEDVFAALRVLGRGQLALLVPLVETSRANPREGSRFGGGIGDLNLSARYDFFSAGQSHVLPGVAVLGGVTFPTGTPPDSARTNVDATGIGSFQASAALAVEQTFGPWLLNATGAVAARTPRSGETLAPQVTLLAAGAYTFPTDVAVAIALSYAFEGDATDDRLGRQPNTSRRLVTVTGSALWPVSDTWRVLGGLFLTPPLDGLGRNEPASAGFTVTVVRSWS